MTDPIYSYRRHQVGAVCRGDHEYGSLDLPGTCSLRDERPGAPGIDGSFRRRIGERSSTRPELYLQSRRDKKEDDRWNAQAVRDSQIFQSELEHYPLESGPGQLRQSLHLADDPSDMPPLVLLMPASRDSDEAWRQLSRRMSNSLMYLQNANLAIVMQADRAFTWPHYALVEYDLRDVPTILISVEVVTGWISVMVSRL